MKTVNGAEVFLWDEFYAFANRLGIDSSQPIIKMIIELDGEKDVIINYTIKAVDTSFKNSKINIAQ